MLKKIVLSLIMISFTKTATAGPVLSAVCTTVCGVISVAGCSGGTWAVGLLNPPAGAMYGAVCTYLAGSGAIAGCAATCMAIPSP